MRNILFETVLLQQIGNIERFYLRAHLHFLISFLHFLPPFLTLKVILLPLLQTASLYVLSSSFLQKHVPPSHSELLGQQNGFESLHFLPSLIMDDLPLHETFQTDPFPFLDPSVMHCASLLPYPLI